MIWLIHSILTFQEIKFPNLTNIAFTGFIPTQKQNSSFLFIGCDQAHSIQDTYQFPLVILPSMVFGSSLQLIFKGLGPLIISQKISLLKNNQIALTNINNLLVIDQFGHGYSNRKNVNINITQFGEDLSKAIKYYLGSEIGKGFKRFNLILQGPMLSAITGMYEVGQNIDNIIWITPWPNFYALGKYYGIAANNFKLISNTQKLIVQSSIAVCYRQFQLKNYNQAFSCYKETLDFIYKKSSGYDLNDISKGRDITNEYSQVQTYFDSSQAYNLLKIKAQNKFDKGAGKLMNSQDLGRDYTKNLTYFFKDFTSANLILITGQKDLVSYPQAIKNWINIDFDFIDKQKWDKAQYTKWQINGLDVGITKSAGQIKYYQVSNQGGRLWHNSIISQLLNKLLNIQKYMQQNQNY